MTIRSTPGLTTQFAVSRLNAQAAQLQQTQQQLSTGNRLHRPSDDPLAVRHSLLQKDRISRLEANIEATQHTQSRLSQAHVQLREAHQLFVRARQIGLSARQATDPSEQRIFAAEVDGLIVQLTNISNSADEAGFLFGGTETRQKPFELDEAAGRVTYSGTPFETKLHLAGDADRAALAPGNRIFLATLRGDSIVVGGTGISAGPGVDTATGLRSLEVVHTSTSYLGGGVTAGTSSVGGDTIVGAPGTHTLQINDTSGTGASGTISLDGGGQVAFTSGDTDLQVLGPYGEVVYVNTTAITAGFNGSVDIQADGTLSIDGGATTTAITFSGNQQITDSVDGSVVHLDTTGARNTGNDTVEFPGTSNAFTALIELRDELLAGNSKPTAERQAALGRRLTEIERVEGHLLDEVGAQSVSLENLGRLVARTEDLKLEQVAAHSETADADLAAAALKLQELLNLQQFTMAAVSQLLQPNLLQFLS
jgi:flagellin-like hook-associated protein FlgL